jgi:5'-3' exonuclease
MNTRAAPLYLVDASIYIFRAWFTVAPRWHADNGLPTHAIRGYAQFLLELLEREAPRRIVAAFDESLGSCFRNEILPDYKCRRELPDEALAFQLNGCRELTQLLGVTTLASARFEADDLIFAAAQQAREDGRAAVVLSRDKDLGQVLLGDDDLLWHFPAAQPVDRASYRERHGIWPQQVPDLLALCGDPVDDVPGVPGIGIKTATSLLQQYADVDAVLDALDEIAVSARRGAARMARTLDAYRDQVRMARRLTALEPAALEGVQWCAERSEPRREELLQFAMGHGFGERLARRLAGVASAAS